MQRKRGQLSSPSLYKEEISDEEHDALLRESSSSDTDALS